MTLQDLGNLGEFVAAVAVLISLVYLAIQVRQNTRWVKIQIFESIVSKSIDWHGRTQDEGLARLYLEGRKGFESLNSGDQLRFGHLMTQAFLLAEVMVDTGEDLLKPTSLDGAKRFILRHFEDPGVRAWWSQDKGSFAADFQEFVDRLVESRGEESP